MSDKTVIEFTLVLCQELCWPRRLVSSFCIISHFIRKPNSIIVTGRLHEPRHLEEDYPIIRVFFENKRFPSFFASGPIKFKVQLCKPVKILEPFELTWPLGRQPSNLCRLLLFLRLRLDNLLQSSPVRVVALYILQTQWFPVHRCNVPLGELFHRPGNIPWRKVRQKPESHHRWRRICSEVVLGSN